MRTDRPRRLRSAEGPIIMSTKRSKKKAPTAKAVKARKPVRKTRRAK